MPTLINPATYIYPPRAHAVIPRADIGFYADMGWIAQLKYNDTHLLLKYLPNGTIELWSRHAERIRNYTCPDWIMEQLQALPDLLGLPRGEYHLLDGGILDGKHPALKDSFVLWDILVRSGEQLLGTTYLQRYNELFGNAPTIPWVYSHPEHGPTRLGTSITPNVFYPGNIPGSEWNTAWDSIVTVVNKPFTVGKPGDKNYKISPLLEGLVLKDPSGALEYGFREANNESWLVRSRVTTGRHQF